MEPITHESRILIPAASVYNTLIFRKSRTPDEDCMKIHFSVPSFRLTFAAIAALGCIFLAQANAQRLPQSVRPEHYTLTLTPDLKAATFTGEETIDVNLAEPSDHITLNAAEIAFENVSATAGGKKLPATVALDKDKQQATFTFPDKLPAGKAILAISYTGILNNELRGFYLSKTAKRNYAVTQFEATDARRAFASFDEPAFKATYDVMLVIDSSDTAISNGEIITDTPGPIAGKHTLKFATTPKMSTYLVAFLVGDFQCTTGESDGVTIRSCSTPDKVALTPYSVDVAKFVLHYYNNYFGISYPLKKLDLIALPDFEAGAMENFGAITYRENALLIDPKTASVGAKKEVVEVIAHEMAHQWFGDLVTMQWWDNLWLNEGFATWMSNKPTAAMHPEWNIDQSVVSGVNGTLGLDSQPTTRAIRAKADTPDEINQMFDGIAYGKASDVLLTVENYLGEETFRQGVHNYLAAHLYANATAEDFWGAQTSTSHKPVDKIMESLVAQPGAPIVTFGEPAMGQVTVSQKRFYLSPSIQPDPAQKWTIPVCFKSSDSQSCELLTPSTDKLNAPAGTLFFANAGGKGYYRSSYPPSVYAALVKQVETSLTPAERISLLGDEWAQVRSDKATIGAYLDLVAAVKDDPSMDVVSETAGGISMIYVRLAATSEERAALEAWIRSTYTPVYAKLGPPSGADSSNTRELRAQLFSLLGYYGKDPAVIAQAREIAAKYLADPAFIDATLGQSALSIAARNGDAALFDQLQKGYESSTNPELQEGALNLLTQFEDPVLVRRSLDYAASGKVRNQDATIQFASALQIDSNRDQAWKYIQNNWEKVQAQFTTAMGAALVGSTSSFCTADGRASVEKFFATHKVAASDVALRHALERIDGCIEFRKLQEPNLKQWLAAQLKP
jgi:aminopeptidase N/puromycin-sensitive aminopeptidase